MIFLGCDVWSSTYEGKTYINKRCYFAKECNTSEGGKGYKQSLVAVPTNNIDISVLVPFCDYMCELIPQEVKDSNGNVITKMILNDIALKN